MTTEADRHMDRRTAIWTWDLASGRVQWSEALCSIVGSTAEALGSNFDALIERVHPDDRASLSNGLRAVCDGGTFQAPVQLRRLDGGERQLEVFGERLGSVVVACFAQLSPESDPDAAAAAARITTMFESAPCGMVLVDSEHRIELVNRRLADLAGYPRRELVGQTIDLLVPDSVRAHHHVHRKQFAAANRTRPMGTEITVELRRADGEVIPVEVGLSPVAGSGSLIATVVDIRGRLHAEAERRTLETQAQRAAHLEAIGKLAGGIAHDFNNLIQVILMASEMAREAVPVGSEAAEDFDDIVGAARRGRELTRRLLAFGRRQQLEPRRIDVGAIVDGVERLLRRVIGEDVDIACLRRGESGTVHADPVQLERVILNLAVNARDAMPDGGRLEFATCCVDLEVRRDDGYEPIPPGAYVVMSVRDSGIGIAADVAPHIFEPFFSTRTQEGGTGLGLSTVYGVVKQSGGYVDVRTRLGQGTLVEVWLPRLLDAPDLVGEPSGASADTAVECSRLSVLLVEDAGPVRRGIARMLEGAGHQVAHVATAEEALSRLRDGARPDVLLTDVVLTGISGLELARRTCANQPGLPMLLMTGYGASASDFDDMPCIKLLQKPFDRAALLAAINGLFAR